MEQDLKIRRLEDLLPKAVVRRYYYIVSWRYNVRTSHLANTVSNLVKTMAQSPEHYGNNWEVGDFIENQNLKVSFKLMLSNTSAVVNTKETKVKDLAKAIHYLQHELEKTQSDWDRLYWTKRKSSGTLTQFAMTIHLSGRLTQKCLIDEEWSEFHEAFHHKR